MLKRTKAAIAFQYALVSLGALTLVAGVTAWDSEDPVRYAFCLALAGLSAGWKVALPAFPGTVSVGGLFILLGVADFTLEETIGLGMTALLVQTWFDRRERTSFQTIIFRLCNLVIAISVAHHVYDAAHNGSPAGVLWAIIPAAVIFGLMNTLPAAALQAFSEKRGLFEIWHECGYWTLPHYLLAGAVAAAISSLNAHVGWHYVLPILPLIYPLYQRASRHLETQRVMRAGAEILVSRHNRTMEALALAIAARFRAASDHLYRTQTYSLSIADQLEVSTLDREAIRIASLLHDVGTLAVPEQIMCKTGRLTVEEFEKVKVHPVVGASIIERAEFPFPVAEIVRSHHERWDGKGYPDGLQGSKIHIGARILAVVDCLVALSSDRPDRPAMPFDRAVAFVASQSGAAFDPVVVETALASAAEFEKIAGRPVDGVSDFVASIAVARRESQAVYEFALEIGHSLSLQEILSTAAQRLQSMISFEAIAFYVRDQSELVPEFASGLGQTALRSLRFKVGVGPLGCAAGKGEPVCGADPSRELQSPQLVALKSVLGIPLMGADGVTGVLALFRTQKDAFTINELRSLLEIRTVLSGAVENAIRFERAESSATTDYLTGLPNARSLFDRLEHEIARCRRDHSSLSILLGDLDGFKQVNDRYGHLAGNQVLRGVAKALQQHCREYDYVARMGGDEFVVLLPGMTGAAVDNRLRHLSQVVSQAAAAACSGAEVGFSAGQSRYPHDGVDAESLLALADSRMYAMKQRRRVDSPHGYDFDWMGFPANAPSKADVRVSVASTS